MNLSEIPIVDHHAHPLLSPEAAADASGFRQWFSESTDPEIHEKHVPNTLFFRTAIRWLAERLDCEPSLTAVLEARASQPYESWTRTLFEEANIEWLLCDYSYGGSRALNHGQMKSLVPAKIKPILRLEALAEKLIIQHKTFEQMVDAYAAAISEARDQGFVALKSIIAYRSGLAIDAISKDEAKGAFKTLRQQAQEKGHIRLESKPVGDYLIHVALDIAQLQGITLQFHTGFGDNDADLRQANPLHLRLVIEQYRAPIVLLHAGWPFYRESAHLASIYPHLWLDLSLAIPFATVSIPNMLRDILGMAPISKILFATDAFTMPEIFWLAARWGRWGLSQTLESLVDDGFLGIDEAWSAAEDILGNNSRSLYRLPA
jgi:predicted TIM-barrel fold metal-dependent hydrolase